VLGTAWTGIEDEPDADPALALGNLRFGCSAGVNDRFQTVRSGAGSFPRREDGGDSLRMGKRHWATQRLPWHVMQADLAISRHSTIPRELVSELGIGADDA
jgi:hypothetical protein